MERRVRRDSRSSAGPGMRALALGVNLAVGLVRPALAADGGQSPVRHPAAHHAPRPVGGRSLEERVAMLSKALELDARQQAELRKALEDQRQQVSRVWSDTSVPAATRVSITRTVSDRTADRIRAMLNDEQKKRYNPPKAAHEATPRSARPSVETWMNRG
jgi:hypothetical protein